MSNPFITISVISRMPYYPIECRKTALFNNAVGAGDKPFFGLNDPQFNQRITTKKQANLTTTNEIE